MYLKTKKSSYYPLVVCTLETSVSLGKLEYELAKQEQLILRDLKIPATMNK
jgi:hypothetical protein